jgi:hypothetical protein
MKSYLFRDMSVKNGRRGEVLQIGKEDGSTTRSLSRVSPSGSPVGTLHVGDLGAGELEHAGGPGAGR